MLDLVKKSIRSNSDALKFSIQYEAIFNESITESYKKFRKTMGRRAMKYKEFEYWFTKFSNGNMDLDDDRLTDRKPSIVSKLATELKEQVGNALETVGRSIARRLPEHFQDFLNCQVPRDEDKNKNRITFNIYSEESMNIIYQRIVVQYEKFKNGCDISIGKHGGQFERWYRIKGADPLIVAFNHLGLLTSDPENPSECLCIYFHEDEESMKKIQKITDKYISKFNVKDFDYMQWPKERPEATCEEEVKNLPDFEQVFPSMLKTLKPVTLEIIDWSRMGGDVLKSMATTEQFLNAKIVNPGYILPEDISNFYRFPEFYVFLDEVPKQILVDLKNALEKSTTFKQCKLYSKNVACIEDVEEVFGTSYTQKGIVARREIIPDDPEDEWSVFDNNQSFIKIKRVH